jgi:SAM-dependent methyltransferase
MLGKLKTLYDLPPRASVRLIRNKILGRGRNVGPGDILANAGLMRPQKPHDFLSRYEAILARAVDWEPLDFQDKRVLEIGCGPLFGFVPLAVFLGARSGMCLEPSMNPDVLDHPGIVSTYFRGLHADLCAIHGPRMDFGEFMDALKTRMRLERAPLQEADLGDGVDVVLSNSCLEHIRPLEESLAVLGRAAAPGCRFLHSVNFSDHRDKAEPFKNIYTRMPEQFFSVFGLSLNLYRPSEVRRALESAGFETRMTPYVVREDLVPERIHPHWRDGFDRRELAVRVALFSGKKAAGTRP